ncbi:hypothetical protein U8527_10220 [Kordia algicida OT-1]|uniref:Uncharacterized protein n=1 Tax=Kordia algicida OT-1 TaxID=391587 RepID=A9DVX7_9FLAO|nr:hypothetical protein [Kordia algicida]EDP96480.1 hypothetical protein KAOT1_03687 [Kordia algicida OT-1]
MDTEHYITVVGFIVTIFIFYIGQRNQLKALERQIQTQSDENKVQHLHSFQNSFWQKQLDLYVKVTTAAAELTQFELNSESYKNSRKNFYTYFWGPMSIVEDSNVKKAMENFSESLLNYESNVSKTSLRNLENHSYQLAQTCRNSSIKRWDLKSFELEPDKE